jgi:hypothetical protein
VPDLLTRWLLMLAVLAVIGLVVVIAATRYRHRHVAAARAEKRRAATEPTMTGAYLRGRVDRITEGVVIVALTGPGNNGQRLTIVDTGQYVVGDRVTVYQYTDDTWRPVVETGAQP